MIRISKIHINELKMPSATIYPNPSSGKFIIKLHNNNIHSYIITNTLGNIIFQSNISNMQFEVDLSLNPKGIYFLNLISNKFNEVKSIIKLY